MYQEILGGFEFDLFDVPILLVPFPCPIDLDPVNKRLAEIAGYEQDVLDADGRPQQRVRAVWGGTERAFFCENDIFKYTHRAEKNNSVGINVYDESRKHWIGPLPMNVDKWEAAITRKHGRTKGEAWCKRRAQFLKKACLVRDVQAAFICVGRFRIYIEQWVHPEALKPGWAEARYFRDLAGGDIDQQTIDEYNDWRLYAKRMRELHADITDRKDRKEKIVRKVKAFRRIARTKDQPIITDPRDLPFELRANLVQRRRDILGKPPEYGDYSTLFVVQKPDGGYKPVDQEVYDIVGHYWRRAETDPLVKGVTPGHATPADQLAARVDNIYKALRDAEIASRLRREEEDREDGFTSSQLVMTGQGPKIITGV